MAMKGEGYATEYSRKYGKPFDEILHDWYWIEDMSQKEIAEKIGTTTSYVSRLFKKFEIQKKRKNYWCYGAPTLYQVTIGNNVHDVTGKMRTPAGYINLCIPSHPFASRQRRIQEHRVIMEIYLGRYLEPDECIHHENGIKDDNRIGNLKIMDKGKHTAMHNKAREYGEGMRRKVSTATKERFKNKKNHPSYKDIDEKVIEMIRAGKKPTEISRELGITRKTVYNKIDYLNLKEMYANVK